MNTIYLSEFLTNTENIIKHTIQNNEINKIKLPYGNVILMSEHEFMSLLNSMHKSDSLFNKIE